MKTGKSVTCDTEVQRVALSGGGGAGRWYEGLLGAGKDLFLDLGGGCLGVACS